MDKRPETITVTMTLLEWRVTLDALASSNTWADEKDKDKEEKKGKNNNTQRTTENTKRTTGSNRTDTNTNQHHISNQQDNKDQ